MQNTERVKWNSDDIEWSLVSIDGSEYMGSDELVEMILELKDKVEEENTCSILN